MKKSEQLFQKQWLIARQHLILDELLFGRNRPAVSSSSTSNNNNKYACSTQSCAKYSLLSTNTVFVESHKVFGHNDYHVSEFVKGLRHNPIYLANIVVKSERQQQFIAGVDNQRFGAQHILPICFQSLYGNCVLKQDEYLCLQLLKSLMRIQFGNQSTDSFSLSPPSCLPENTVSSSKQQQQANSSNTKVNSVDLRRLMRKQSNSFNILFKLYTSFAYSAQLFLTAALSEPITQMLADAEWYLDIDADKALARFTADEIVNL